MKKLLLAAATALLAAHGAEAVPLTFVAQPGSTFTYTLSTPVLGTATGSGAVTGSLVADVDLTGGTLTIAPGASGSFSVADFAATGSALGTLDLVDIVLTLTNPAGAVVPGPDPYTVDLGGSTFSVGGNAMLGASSFVYHSGTDTVVVPTGSHSTLTGGASLTWTMPFTTTSSYYDYAMPIDFTFSTNLVLQAVPEPDTMLLLVAGLGVLAAGARWRA